MRVTNEQAKALVICGKYDWCEECEKYDDGCPLYGCGIIFEKELATDLLEDRELIEKQEAIIKEMREALNGFRVGNCFCECGIDNPMMNGRHTKNCIQANAILEKTKDYA